MPEPPTAWRGVTWQPEPDEIERAITHGLRWDGRRRAREVHHVINRVAAENIFAQLRADDFVFMRQPPQAASPAGEGTGPYARVENLTRGRRFAHCRECGHERELNIASLIAQGWGNTLVSKLPLVCECGSRNVGIMARFL